MLSGSFGVKYGRGLQTPDAARMVQYNGGMEGGPHVFAHRPSGCTDGEMSLGCTFSGDCLDAPKIL